MNPLYNKSIFEGFNHYFFAKYDQILPKKVCWEWRKPQTKTNMDTY